MGKEWYVSLNAMSKFVQLNHGENEFILADVRFVLVEQLFC